MSPTITSLIYSIFQSIASLTAVAPAPASIVPSLSIKNKRFYHKNNSVGQYADELLRVDPKLLLQLDILLIFAAIRVFHACSWRKKPKKLAVRKHILAWGATFQSTLALWLTTKREEIGENHPSTHSPTHQPSSSLPASNFFFHLVPQPSLQFLSTIHRPLAVHSNTVAKEQKDDAIESPPGQTPTSCLVLNLLLLPFGLALLQGPQRPRPAPPNGIRLWKVLPSWRQSTFCRWVQGHQPGTDPRGLSASPTPDFKQLVRK